jgi:hypothetical protein
LPFDLNHSSREPPGCPTQNSLCHHC